MMPICRGFDLRGHGAELGFVELNLGQWHRPPWCRRILAWRATEGARLAVGFRHGDFDFILRTRRAGDPCLDELNRFGLGHSTAAAMMRCRHDPRVNACASGGTRGHIAQEVWMLAGHGFAPGFPLTRAAAIQAFTSAGSKRIVLAFSL
jgi:hypothetical protein